MMAVGDNSEQDEKLKEFTYLLLDDDRFSRTLIKTALGQYGIRSIIEAENAIKAIEIMKDEKIDILLVDHEMPGVTGMEFINLVRKAKEGINNNDLPIVMITANMEKETVLGARKLNVQEYVVKPISPLSLKKRLQSAISKAGL
jgi:two-component system chemotaxis response regulator CheY